MDLDLSPDTQALVDPRQHLCNFPYGTSIALIFER